MTKSNVSFPNKSSVDSNNRLLSKVSGIEIHPNFLKFLDWCDEQDRDPEHSNKITKKQRRSLLAKI